MVEIVVQTPEDPDETVIVNAALDLGQGSPECSFAKTLYSAVKVRSG